jgi:putative tryptophan/tyrosine transport system substrate-binding protein
MQFGQLKRRKFLALLACAAVTTPFGVRAQQSVPVVGFLNIALPSQMAYRVAAFNDGLKELGYVEGQNVTIEYRWAEGRLDRLPALAADLVQRHVAVIAATGGLGSAQAAQSATKSIPIVFTSGSDPIQFGLVSSLAHPGGNITGATLMSGELPGKRLGLLGELLPKIKLIAVLVNSNNLDSKAEVVHVQEAAQKLGYQLQIVQAGRVDEFEAAFATLIEQQVDALIVTTDPFFESYRDWLIALSAKHRIPTVYSVREYAVSGGLISYGASIPDLYRQAGIYVGRILKGARPADLPVMQPTKFELVLNLKAAKTLGLTVPLIMQMTANEVIE